MGIPAAIIFVNNDLTANTRYNLEKQLYITDTMDGYAYDGYVELYPDWPTNVKLQNKRILVIRPFTETTNRKTADVVIFVTHGDVAIEQNKFGPPGAVYKLADIHWGKLCIFSPNIYNS